tara:strand:+ start:176 stop:1174 length:999 start_codon:yes stop_codon:yes gene_type:complete
MAGQFKNYRGGYLQQGAVMGMVHFAKLLSADNQVVNPNKGSLCFLSSDNTTATNRTFTLLDGQFKGQKLTINFNVGSSYTCDLQSTGNVTLVEAWQPLQYEVLEIMWDGVEWCEVARSVTGIVALSIVNADINASAAIAWSKMAAITDGSLIVGNSSTVPTVVALSGDVTMINTGAVTIGAGAVDLAMNNAAVIKEATGTLTQANLLAAASLVVVIAAPGAGLCHIIDEVELFHDYDTTVYATGSDLALEYATSGDNIALVVDSFVTAGADATALIKPSTYDLDGSTGTASGFDLTSNANQAIQFQASNFTNGSANNIIKWRIRYHTVTLIT